MVLTKENTVNLFKMIASEDQDNKYIALKSIDEVNIDESLGFIMLLYKFSGISSSIWNQECPKVWSKFKSIHLIDDKSPNPISVSASKVIRTMIAQHCNIEALTMFLQLHNDSLLNVLKAWGYDLSDLEIYIKLKEHAKHAESS